MLQLLESPLIYLTGLFVLGITAQWLAWRLKLPAILLLLMFGFLANLVVDPTVIIDDKLLFPIVSLSVAIILFDGGLSLRLAELKNTSKALTRLVTVGCLITWILGTLFAKLIFDSWWVCALAGAIYTVTGPTVIGPLLRHVRPNATVTSVAKWEGIVIDPIGALLAVLVSTAIASSSVTEATFDIIVSLGAAIAISTVIGFITAYIMIVMIRKHLIPDYLQSPLMLMSVLASYTLSNVMLAESGLATVTVLGILMANQRSVPIGHLIEFKENLGVLLISVLFILLASRYPFMELLDLGWPAVLFLVLMIGIVRPLAVMISTSGTTLKWKERIFLSVLAPRGIVAAAVSSVFALELSHLAHVEHTPEATAMLADLSKLVPLTFVVIVGTVAFYGLTAGPLARYLGLSERSPQGILIAGADHVARAIGGAVNKEGFRVLLVDTNHENIKEARMLGLPAVNASILSEYAREELNLGGIGRFLALTPNDQVNMLAALEFHEIFERADLFQLKPNVSEKHRQALSHQSKRARYVFSGGTTYRTISDLITEGSVVKSTKLTSEFPYSAFVKKYGAQAVPLFVISESRKLEILTDEDRSEPQAGETLIALVPDLTYAKVAEKLTTSTESNGDSESSNSPS